MTPEPPDSLRSPAVHPCTVPLSVTHFRLSRVLSWENEGRKRIPVCEPLTLYAADGSPRVEWPISEFRAAVLIAAFGGGTYRASWMRRDEAGAVSAAGVSQPFELRDPNATHAPAPAPPAPPAPPPPPAPLPSADAPMLSATLAAEQAGGVLNIALALTNSIRQAADVTIERDRVFVSQLVGQLQRAPAQDPALAQLAQAMQMFGQSMAQLQNELRANSEATTARLAQLETRLAAFDEGDEEDEEEDEEERSMGDEIRRQGQQIVREGLPLLMNQLMQPNANAPAAPAPQAPPAPTSAPERGAA